VTGVGENRMLGKARRKEPLQRRGLYGRIVDLKTCKYAFNGPSNTQQY
jgi:hypothetical protein